MRKRTIKFKKSQGAFLLKTIDIETVKSKIQVALYESLQKPESSITISLTQDEVEEVLNELTFQFTSKGIDTTHQVNDVGLYIEDLIDIFSKHVYEE